MQYDRCLEQDKRLALQKHFGLDKSSQGICIQYNRSPKVCNVKKDFIKRRNGVVMDFASL